MPRGLMLPEKHRRPIAAECSTSMPRKLYLSRGHGGLFVGCASSVTSSRVGQSALAGRQLRSLHTYPPVQSEG